MRVLPLAELPETCEHYDTLLRGKGTTHYKADYLPYAIVDGWQQIRRDFAGSCRTKGRPQDHDSAAGN
jgi:hypothetical protein